MVIGHLAKSMFSFSKRHTLFSSCSHLILGRMSACHGHLERAWGRAALSEVELVKDLSALENGLEPIWVLVPADSRPNGFESTISARFVNV